MINAILSLQQFFSSFFTGLSKEILNFSLNKVDNTRFYISPPFDPPVPFIPTQRFFNSFKPISLSYMKTNIFWLWIQGASGGSWSISGLWYSWS